MVQNSRRLRGSDQFVQRVTGAQGPKSDGSMRDVLMCKIVAGLSSASHEALSRSSKFGGSRNKPGTHIRRIPVKSPDGQVQTEVRFEVRF